MKYSRDRDHMDDDEYIKVLEREIRELRDELEDYIEIATMQDKLLSEIEAEGGHLVKHSGKSKKFFDDDDYDPGTLKMQYKHESRSLEIITPKYKEEFEGLTMSLTPKKGFSFGINLKRTPL